MVDDNGPVARASFRFYAELNDFLDVGRRHRDLDFGFGVAPSVKDAVESLGVPHTEVDLVLVNGDSVDFGHRLGDGDRISVFPVFERLDIGRVTKVRPEPLREVRFVVDGHLGTLARRLRLLGFDALFEPGWSDAELAEISARERRILLTRDRGLLKRSAVTHGLFVRGDDPDDQIVDIVRRLQLSTRLRPFTLCTVCNAELHPVDKEEVRDRLPPRTQVEFDHFVECPDCRRVYWEGSHHEQLRGLVEWIIRRADEP